MDESNEVRRQIENNDPNLVELEIGPRGYVPHDGDWEGVGNSIGRNTHLKKITLDEEPEMEIAEEDLKKFFHGVACSRSIQKLHFVGCDLFGGEVFRILLPLFKRSQIDCIELSSIERRTGCFSMITTTIAEFDSLKEFELFYCRIDDNEMEDLIRALAGHSGLRKLDIYGNRLGRNALSALLQNLNSELSVLNLSHSGIDNEGADALGEFDSLKELCLDSCWIDDNGMGQIIQALAGHSGLRKLDLRHTSIGRHACAALAALLRNPNSKLSVLNLGYCGIDDEGADALAPGLADNSTLKDLNLSDNFSITEMGWCAIFAALQSPSCRLEKLSPEGNNGINDAAAVFLPNALRNNTTLKSLNLSSCTITVAGWRALFGFLQDPNCALEELDLSSIRNDGFNDEMAISLSNALTNNRSLKSLNLSWNCEITNAGCISLSNALTNNRSLKSLNLSCNYEITTAGWQAFSNVLQSANSGLEELDLSGNTITDEAVNFIATALINNIRLRELDLSCNRGGATVTGCLAFTVVLENPHSALEKLDLNLDQGPKEISNATLSSFANAVANNSKLKELLLGYASYALTLNWRDAFSRVLCDTSSIMDTYHSNHTLQKVSIDEDDDEYDDEDALPQEIRSLLELNRDNSKAQAARLKIIKTHFSGGFTVHPFVDMEWNVLPRAIAWLCRDGSSNAMNGLYGFIRSVPQFVDAEGNATNQTEGGGGEHKRKAVIPVPAKKERKVL